MLTVPYSVLHNAIYLITIGGMEVGVLGGVDNCQQGGLYAGEGGCKLDFFSSSLLYGTPAPSAERRTPAPRGMASYGHLKGVSIKKLPSNKVLFAGTVPANNLLVINKPNCCN